MTFFRLFLPILGLLVAISAPDSAFAATKKKHNAPAKEAAAPFKGAIVTDASSGKVIFEDNADVVSPPASMTKLMTFAVLQDLIAKGRISLTTPVTVIADDSKIGGTQVWLKEGEVFPVEELLYAMMIQSANDAAYALARTSAGSPQSFVRMMNEKARELGMTHTTFRSPHGLPPSNRNIQEGDLSSPRDFAILARYLLQNTDVLKYSSVRTRNFGSPVRVTPVVMNNHNHLINRVQGVDGLKTGFTNGAGFCLSTTALRDGHRVIVIVMGSPDKKSRDNKVIELLEEGFAQLPPGSPTFTGYAGGGYSATPQIGTTAASDSPFTAAPVTSEGDAPKAAPSGEEPMIKLNLPAPAPKKSGKP